MRGEPTRGTVAAISAGDMTDNDVVDELLLLTESAACALKALHIVNSIDEIVSNEYTLLTTKPG